MNQVAAQVQVPFWTPQARSELQSDIVKDVAKRCFLELAVSSALGAICCCFVATPAGVATIALSVVIQAIIGLAIRCYVGYHDYKHQIDPNHKVAALAKWLGAYAFAINSANNAQVVVHEAGHAIAVNALLKDANPKITLFPYAGGVTSWRVGKEVTDLGKAIGRENFQPVIAAAGPFLTLALSTILLGTGLAIQDAAPEVSRMLIVSALMDFLSHIIYALSAMAASLTNFSHDFVALWQLGGIHPLTAAITIAAIPILVLSAYFALQKSQ